MLTKFYKSLHHLIVTTPSEQCVDGIKLILLKINIENLS